MQLKQLMKELVDAVDGAGREFKTGFAGAFRKRGGRHRADADAIRGLDRRSADSVPRHRAEPATSHAKKYDILSDVSRGIESQGRVARHASPDYNAMQDLGRSVGKSVHDIPGDIVDEVKGVPKTVPKQLVEELYEDAIGQDDPDKYGRKDGDMKFLAPSSESGDLSALSQSELESRLGLGPGALDGAAVEVKQIPDSRFVSVEIDYPGSD
ncbi:hypothetical protein [Microbacterium sp. KRD172]|uniref:hypothetical protein n=1 Tax=Microbacterium sp. KRD172 TaxID=2729727 RepID=UPI0019D18369|nr:hypothetical protein [Microbacterium sp. KRD172]